MMAQGRKGREAVHYTHCHFFRQVSLLEKRAYKVCDAHRTVKAKQHQEQPTSARIRKQ